MSLSLKRVGDPDTQFNLERIGALFPDAGNQVWKIRWGTGTVTFSANNDSSTATVDHGLGGTPVVVLVSSIGENQLNYMSQTYTATTFQVAARCTSGSITKTTSFSWIAIG